MAKFFYRMQNILDIKLKLEEQAKQEYADARFKLTAQEKKLDALKERRHGYYLEYQGYIQGRLDFLKIDEAANAMDIMDEQIDRQHEEIRKCSKELEQARIKLEGVTRERKMQEKLKEKDFEAFLLELSAQETKETDEVVSYQFNSAGKDLEE